VVLWLFFMYRIWKATKHKEVAEFLHEMEAHQKIIPRAKTRLAIVTPMANEGAGAGRFVKAVLQQCDGFREVKHFVVLDNVCKDNTRELLEELALTEPRLEVIWAPENRSVVDAYMRGYREALQAGSDWILEIDAGFSHQPEDIPQFFDVMETGEYDCVFGSRFMEGGRISDSSKSRWLTSRLGTVLSTVVLGTRMKDMTSGFEMFTRDTLEYVLKRGIHSRGPFFQTEIKFHCESLRYCEVPIHYKAASHSVGKSALKDALTHLWRLRNEKKKTDSSSATKVCGAQRPWTNFAPGSGGGR
jgi:dolichol-phosphate mannosyltransferase